MAAQLEVGFVDRRCNVLSPMAESLAVAMGGGAVAAESAGLEPAGRVMPSVLTALREVGLDTSELAPHEVDRAWLEGCDAVVAIGVDVTAGPLFEGLVTDSWDLESPEGGQLVDVRRARDEIAVRVRRLLKSHGIDVRGSLSELG